MTALKHLQAKEPHVVLCGAVGDILIGGTLTATCVECMRKFVLANELQMTGSGDFSIGSKVWPGTSKLLEEMGELQQMLGKLIAVAGSTEHWDGDLRPRLLEEIADVSAALGFFVEQNLAGAEEDAMADRITEKLMLFRKWHKEHTKPEEVFGDGRGLNDGFDLDEIERKA
jgi:hypothetical protein